MLLARRWRRRQRPPQSRAGIAEGEGGQVDSRTDGTTERRSPSFSSEAIRPTDRPSGKPANLGSRLVGEGGREGGRQRMNGGVGGSSSEAVTWIALHWQRSRGRRRRRSGRWWRRPTPTDRPTDRGRLPQRMSEGLVGAGNRCAAAAAAEAVASPESRQTDRLLLLSVRPSSLSLFRSCSPFFLLSSQRTDRPTAANWRRN